MKKSKMNTEELLKALRERNLTAETFNNGIHWRLKSEGIDLYPTTGNWKWMGTAHNGTLDDFKEFLDGHFERKALVSDVIVRSH